MRADVCCCPSDCAALDRASGPNSAAACRSIEELTLLFDISYTLESSLELRDVIRPVMAKMAETLGMQRSAIALYDDAREQLVLSEAVGLSGPHAKDNYFKCCQEVLREVATSGKPVIVADILQDSVLAELAHIDLEGCGSARPTPTAFICVPIRFGENTLGCLSAERVVEGECAATLEADRRLLSLVCNVIAQSVHFHLLAQKRVRDLQRENERLQEQIQTQFRPRNIIGNSNAMRSLFMHIEQVASSNTTVLIRGESGVGKELVARALHEQSNRKNKAFVKFNCAALPESIIESELFGHERGAFTGAISMRKGRFEIADQGTIFLDEIGDVSPATQVKLLRVLQEKEFERVGGAMPIRCDVRILTATSRNLEQMIEEGKFRSDLYYRLNVFPIYVPPLRERKSDLLQLADHFVEKFSACNGKKVRRISTAAIDLLVSYHWPGNVRELENCMERAVLLAQGTSIEAHHLPPTLQKKDPSESGPSGAMEAAVSALEYEMIVAELKSCEGNMSSAARNLGLTERQMGLRVKRYNIDYKRFRSTTTAAK